ncbi:MAG: 2-oxo acid dehydrogenase subunit E2 [Candidatus Marinimicrobia bacterium]|nr:2-oxo acid dehydrogenase subunit E2 [Candidatus Neomarinimicrobiota bacterium]
MIEELKLPELGEGIDSVEISEIRVKAGDTVNVDDVVLVVETEKATMEIPATSAGTVKDIKVKVGDAVGPGGVLMTVEAAGDSASKSESSQEEQSPAKSASSDETADETSADEKPASEEASSKKPQPKPERPAVPQPEKGEPTPELEPRKSTGNAPPLASPAIRKFARELGADLERVSGTGPKNRILKSDVEAYIKQQVTRAQSGAGGGVGIPQAPEIDFSQWGEIETIGLNKIRRLTGQNMQQSWQVAPHVTQFEEADITALEAFRKSEKAAAEARGTKLTILPFIMKAVVAALKAFPDANASLDPSGESLIRKKYYHLGIAVDTEQGLMVPVVRDVDKKSIMELAEELADLSERTRERKVTPAELKGASFTISSLGGIGGTYFTPIVNTPEVAILGVSRAAMKPIWRDGEFVPRLILPFSLSYDHRVIDGAAGARFTKFVSDMLSDIRRLLL